MLRSLPVETAPPTTLLCCKQPAQHSVMYDNLNRQLYSSRLSDYYSEPVSSCFNRLPWRPNDLVNTSDDSPSSDTQAISLKECSERERMYITHNTYYLWSNKYCWLWHFLLSAPDPKILVPPTISSLWLFILQPFDSRTMLQSPSPRT